MKSKIETVMAVFFVVSLAVILMPISIVIYGIEFLRSLSKKLFKKKVVKTEMRFDEMVNEISLKF